MAGQIPGSIDGLLEMLSQQQRPSPVPNRVYQPQPQPMGQLTQEQGKLLSMVRGAEQQYREPSSPQGRTPMVPQMKPVGPAYSTEPNIWSKMATGIRGAGNAVDQAQTGLVDNIAELTGLNKFQNSLLDGTRSPEGVGGSPATAADLQEIVPGGTKKEQPKPTNVEQLKPTSTLEDASKAAQADHKAEREQMNQAIAAKTREDLTAKGATKEQLQGWDKFTDEYDLGVIGMALLASNDGSGNIWSNLGMAMMEGKKSRTEEKDKLTATQQQDLENELAILKSQREGADVVSQIGRRTNQNKVDSAGLPIRQQGADAASLSAAASMIRAKNSGQGAGSASDKAISASARNAAGAYLANNPRYDWGKLTEGQRGNITSKTGDNYKELIQAAEAAGEAYDEGDVMSIAADMAAEESDLTLTKDGFFGLYGNPVYERK